MKPIQLTSGSTINVPAMKKRKLTSRFIRKVEEDFRRHGDTAIERMRQETPAAYCQMIAKMVPTEVNLAPSAAFLSILRDSADVARVIDGDFARIVDALPLDDTDEPVTALLDLCIDSAGPEKRRGHPGKAVIERPSEIDVELELQRLFGEVE